MNSGYSFPITKEMLQITNLHTYIQNIEETLGNRAFDKKKTPLHRFIFVSGVPTMASKG